MGVKIPHEDYTEHCDICNMYGCKNNQWETMYCIKSGLIWTERAKYTVIWCAERDTVLRGKKAKGRSKSQDCNSNTGGLICRKGMVTERNPSR